MFLFSLNTSYVIVGYLRAAQYVLVTVCQLFKQRCSIKKLAKTPTLTLTLTLTLFFFNQSKIHLPPDLAADEKPCILTTKI
jgi:hypothetical protein